MKKNVVRKEREVNESYENPGFYQIVHRRMSPVADELAQDARRELLGMNVADEQIRYAGWFGLRCIAGGPILWVTAFEFDPLFDWDKI